MRSSRTNPIDLYSSTIIYLIIGRPIQEFSLGGEADSTYEYFIKEHLLLGGAKEQYKNLYIRSVEAAENFLFFRPLVEGNPEIMFSGKYKSNYKDDGTPGDGELHGEMQHLV
jgi:mannosyl-oligosaccharide alpha-1,2-mannosidase